MLFFVVHFWMGSQQFCLTVCKVTLISFVWLFSIVYFHMLPQIACKKWCKVTLVALVQLFSTVSGHMCFQMACMGWCTVALVTLILIFPTLKMVTFIWFYPILHFNMCLKITFLQSYKFALIAFVGFLSTLLSVFSYVSSNCLPERMRSHIGCTCSIFLCFSKASSTCLLDRMKNHTGCICLTYLLYASGKCSTTTKRRTKTNYFRADNHLPPI